MARPAYVQTLERTWQNALETAGRFMDDSDLASAETAALDARKLASRIGPDSRESALSLNFLGRIYERQGRLAAAERSYRDALSLWDRLPGGDTLGLVTILNNFSHLYVQNGRFLEAEPTLKRTAALRLGDEPGVPLQQVRTCELMLMVAMAQRRQKEAAVLARRLLALSERAYPPSHPEIAMAWNNLGLVALASNHPAEAITPLSKALGLAQTSLGRQDSGTATVMANLGQAYTRTKQLDSAELLLTSAVKLVETADGPSAPSTAQVLAPYAELLRKRNRKDEAKRIEARVQAILAASGRGVLGRAVAITDLRR